MGIKKLFQLPLFFYIRDSFYGNIIKKKVHLIYLPFTECKFIVTADRLCTDFIYFLKLIHCVPKNTLCLNNVSCTHFLRG